MDLTITFDDEEMKTSVYIQMDAHDQLLLSEGVPSIRNCVRSSKGRS